MPYFDLLTWRECVVGMKPTESVQMEMRRTWDIRPRNVARSGGIERTGGGVNSETLGFVRWRMSDTTLFDKPCRLLRTEGYDQKAHLPTLEEVWTTPTGEIVRQREERTSEAGKLVAEAVFWPDRIELTRVDRENRSTFSTVNPVGGMDEVQRRFKPMMGSSKEFLRLDAIAGTLQPVKIERQGRFRGNWGQERYDGTTYRFTVGGQKSTLMMTTEAEIVQVEFTEETSLVLNAATRSRRKGEPHAVRPPSRPSRPRLSLR